MRITRIDQHPLIKQAVDGGGSFRGEVSVTGGVRQLAGGVAKVPVNVPGLGDVALFMNPDHLTPQVMNAQPGTGLVLAARVRASDQADLIPITLSSSRSAELAHEPQGIAGASAQVRSTIRELARGLTETTAGTRWGSWLGDAPSLIPGMVLGDTSLMSPEVRQTFLATGLSHLTAVSGLHVAIVASSVMVATTAVGLARRTRLACVMGSILLFALVVGPEPSIIRATTMGLVGVVTVASSRWSDSLSALAVAVLLVLLCAPGMAVRYSLVLSVVATIAIIAGSPLLGRQLIRAWQRVTRRRWSRDPSVAEAMVLRAFAVAIVADVATQPIIVLMTGVFPPPRRGAGQRCGGICRRPADGGGAFRRARRSSVVGTRRPSSSRRSLLRARRTLRVVDQQRGGETLPSAGRSRSCWVGLGIPVVGPVDHPDCSRCRPPAVARNPAGHRSFHACPPPRRVDHRPLRANRPAAMGAGPHQSHRVDRRSVRR